jgi:hypothetical protein
MQNRDVVHRIVLPTSIVLVTMLLARLVYFHSSSSVATVSGVIMFLSIGFGTLLIYPVSLFRGAGLWERIIGCLVTPVVWNAIEIYNVSEAFTLPESLFYGLNILFLGTVAGQFLSMGVCDFLCRLRLRRVKQEAVKAIAPFTVLACLFGILGIYLVLVWREGVGLHYLLIDVYKEIFV